MFKYKRPKITTTTLKKKEPNWRANTIYFNAYYKVVIIKIMSHWGQKNRHIDEWNRKETRNRPSIYTYPLQRYKNISIKEG